MTTPTLRQLDIFAQMVASGSIDVCAREMGVPRREVEQNMEALEERLGHRLFEIHNGEARLTEAGRTTVAAMQRLSEIELDQWDKDSPPAPIEAATSQEPAAPPPPPVEDALRAEPTPPITKVAPAEAPRAFRPLPTHSDQPPPPAAPISSPARQQVTIAAHPAIFGHFQDALDAFEQTNADASITLDLDTHTAAQAGPILARGHADIAYYYGLGEDGIESRYAWSEPLALYVGETHPLAQPDIVTLAELAGVEPATLLPGNSLRRLIDRALATTGIEPGDPLVETDNLFDIMTTVRQGQGYFAAFGPLARDFGRMPGIKRIPLGIALPAIDVRQAISPGMRNDPLVTALAEYLFR